MKKVGGRFLQEPRGGVHCSCFRDVVIDQIISLHCIEVSSYDCCHQVSDFKAKMHQFDFGLGSVPDALAGFKGPTSKGREGMGGREGKGGLAPRS